MISALLLSTLVMCKHRLCSAHCCMANQFLCSCVYDCVYDMEHKFAIKHCYYIIIVQVILSSYNYLPTHWTRELIKPSEDAESLLVSITKIGKFWFYFFVVDVTTGVGLGVYLDLLHWAQSLNRERALCTSFFF